MSNAPNYLDALAGIQPQAPTERPPERPSSPLGMMDEPAGALAPGHRPPSQGEGVSPELFQDLKPYIEQCVAETVSGVLTTALPDMVRQTLTHLSAPVSSSPPSAVTPVAPAVQADSYETPVPMLHMAASPYRRYRPMDWACWVACGGIVAMMAGLAAYTIGMSPQTQTTRHNQQLTQSHQVLTEQLVESNQQVLDSRQRCGNFSLICTIKE